MTKLRRKVDFKPFEIGDATFEGKIAKNILRSKGAWSIVMGKKRSRSEETKMNFEVNRSSRHLKRRCLI